MGLPHGVKLLFHVLCIGTQPYIEYESFQREWTGDVIAYLARLEMSSSCHCCSSRCYPAIVAAAPVVCVAATVLTPTCTSGVVNLIIPPSGDPANAACDPLLPLFFCIVT